MKKPVIKSYHAPTFHRDLTVSWRLPGRYEKNRLWYRTNPCEISDLSLACFDKYELKRLDRHKKKFLYKQRQCTLFNLNE